MQDRTTAPPPILPMGWQASQRLGAASVLLALLVASGCRQQQPDPAAPPPEPQTVSPG